MDNQKIDKVIKALNSLNNSIKLNTAAANKVSKAVERYNSLTLITLKRQMEEENE